MLAHVLGQHTHADAGEVIDREAGVAGVVQWEEALEAGAQDLVPHAFLQLRQAHVLSEVLEEDLDEDTATGCRLLLIHVDDRHDMPANRVGADHVAEEASNVAESVCLVAVDCVVVLGECSFEEVRPEAIDLSKSFTDQAVELRIRALLGATFDDHRWELGLEASGQRDLHQFVTAFFEVDTRHDCQVYRPPQVHKVCVGLILDIHLPLFLRLFIGALV